MYFFLLVLGILLNLGSDAGYKQGRFSEILPEKSLEFVLSKESNIVAFNLNLVLLSLKIDSILEKQSCKRDALVAYSTSHIKIILAL